MTIQANNELVIQEMLTRAISQAIGHKHTERSLDRGAAGTIRRCEAIFAMFDNAHHCSC